MSLSKRILFLYIHPSSGHQRAAEAVMNALRHLNPRVKTNGVDSLNYGHPFTGRLVARNTAGWTVVATAVHAA